MMNRRHILLAALVSVSLLLLWTEKRHEAPIRKSVPLARSPVHRPDVQASKSVAASKPRQAVPVAAKPEIVEKTVPVLKLGSFLVEDDRQGPLYPPRDALSKLPAADKGIDLDLGRDLPWPERNTPWLLPGNKDTGFHVGLNFRLDNRWDLTGLAGVKMTGGFETYPLKPNIEQIGVVARYRF